MVHALRQAHRVLRAGGSVIDLRPDRDPGGRRAKPMTACLVLRGIERPAGALIETAAFHADYVAADRAVAQSVRRGLFSVRSTERLQLRIHVRSLDVLEEKLKTEWTGTTLPPQTRRRLGVLLRRHRSAHLVVVDTYRLTVLQKTTPRGEARL